MDEKSLLIGVIGGIGLGLLLGSEFSGRYATIAGAILVVVALFSMAFCHTKGRSTNP